MIWIILVVIGVLAALGALVFVIEGNKNDRVFALFVFIMGVLMVISGTVGFDSYIYEEVKTQLKMEVDDEEGSD